MKKYIRAKIASLKSAIDLLSAYPGTGFLALVIFFGNVVAYFCRGLMRPLSAFSATVMLDILPFLTYFMAHFALRHNVLVVSIFLKIQLIFEVVAIIIIGVKIEKKIGTIPTIVIFFISNVIGGLFAVFFDILAPTMYQQRKSIIYVGNYAGIMSLLCIYTFYRPRSRETLFLILPGNILLPYRSKSMNILLINLGIALAFLYFPIIPFNYVCFQSVLVIYPTSYVFYVAFIRNKLYSNKLTEILMA